MPGHGKNPRSARQPLARRGMLPRLSIPTRKQNPTGFAQSRADRLPIWIAIELWDFGMLSNFYAGMQDTHKFDIASKYNIPRFKLLETWLRSINHIRNICAHHGRLWNRNLDDQPAPTRTGEIQLLDHISME